MVMQRNLHRALDRDDILRAVSAFYGVTTADGNVAGTTLICDALIGSNDFITNKTILLQSGLSIFEDSGATAFAPLTGQITVNPAFSSQVLGGTSFYVLNAASAAALIAALAPVVNVVTGNLADNWQINEQDLVTIGANNISNKLHLLVIGIQNLVGNITIRLYMQVNGVERRIYPYPANLTWNAVTDAPAIPVVNATMGIHEAVRVTIESDNAADNGQFVDYDYMLEVI